jgi:predicted RNA-binding protein YlxR (DUF448 family)
MDAELDSDLTERMCIVTREVKDEAALVRFVRGPDGMVVPDLQRKLPGRGVWVSLSRERVAEAVKKNLFSRAFGAETRAFPELADLVGDLLRKSALSTFSLSKKAGLAVAGNSKVEDMVNKNRALIILHAAEAAADGRRKIDNLAAADVKVINIFQVDELDLAFGRSNVIHAAVARGKLADKLLLAVQRIEMYDAHAERLVTEERA